VLACLLSGVAHADSIDDLQASGEQLARDGRYGDAIAKFKEANHLEPRPIFACLIALAYTRKENWPQAELFLSQCRERQSAGTQLPDWVPEAENQIKEKLAAAGLVAVTISVRPSNAGVTLTVSSFAPDETFGPRTIYLPVGTHAIVARAPGYPEVKRVLEIHDSFKPLSMEIDLDAAPVRPQPRRGALLLKGGAVTLGVGLLSYAVFGYAWSKEKSIADSDPTNDADYNKYYDLYTYTRISTIALWTAGTGLVISGLVVRSIGHTETAPAVSFAPTRGGGMVGLSWQR
jgi:hypothetical protein